MFYFILFTAKFSKELLRKVFLYFVDQALQSFIERPLELKR